MAIIDINIPYEAEIIKKKGRVSQTYMMVDTVPVEIQNNTDKMETEVFSINYKHGVNKKYGLTPDNQIQKAISNNDLRLPDDCCVSLNSIYDLTALSRYIIQTDDCMVDSCVLFFGNNTYIPTKVRENRIEEENIKTLISDNRDERVKKYNDYINRFTIYEDKIFMPKNIDEIFILDIDPLSKRMKLTQNRSSMEDLVNARPNRTLELPFYVQDMDICFTIMQHIIDHYTDVNYYVNSDDVIQDMNIDFQALDSIRQFPSYLLRAIVNKLTLTNMVKTNSLTHELVDDIANYNHALSNFKDNPDIETAAVVYDTWNKCYQNDAFDHMLTYERQLPAIIKIVLQSLNYERSLSKIHVDFTEWNRKTNSTNLPNLMDSIKVIDAEYEKTPRIA